MTVTAAEGVGATGATTPADVRLEGVTKRFDDVVAVDDLSLDIERGAFFAMLGPSDPDNAAAELAAHIGAPVAIVDANNINVEVLGTSPAFPVDRMSIRETLLDNPLGQNDERTPIILVRPL